MKELCRGTQLLLRAFFFKITITEILFPTGTHCTVSCFVVSSPFFFFFGFESRTHALSHISMFLARWSTAGDNSPIVFMYISKKKKKLHNKIISIFLLLCLGQVFLFHPQLRVNEGDAVGASFSMNRSKENHRLMEVEFVCELRQPSGKCLPAVTSKFYIEWGWNVQKSHLNIQVSKSTLQEHKNHMDQL